MAANWRNIIALFVNEHTRRVAGRLLAGETVDPEALELPPSRRRHVVSAITSSGIAATTDDGRLELAPEVFPRLLAEGARPARAWHRPCRTMLSNWLTNSQVRWMIVSERPWNGWSRPVKSRNRIMNRR